MKGALQCMAADSMTAKVAKMVEQEQNAKARVQQPKRMTVTIQPEDYQKLSSNAEALGISKTKYLALLVTAGLKN